MQGYIIAVFTAWHRIAGVKLHHSLNLFIYLFIYSRTQHSKQYKIEDTIKAAKF